MADPAMRRRLRFRSLRRGTRESDLVIGGFASRYLDEMSDDQLTQFEALLDQPDQDLLGWVLNVSTPPSAFDNEVLHMIRNFKKTHQ